MSFWRTSPLALAVAIAAIAACGSHRTSTAADPSDPAACASCHADHVRAWSGSMHAYASDDPLFIAMNARAQRDTSGAIGTFCMNCHSPVAKLRGVTCVACHAGDGAMRAAIADPVATDAHASAYAASLDRARPESAQMCGGCHDVTTPANVAVERTYSEWRATAFAPCGKCHMPETDGVAAAGGPMRRVHDHAMPGVDVALAPWPESDAQRKAVQSNLDPAIAARLCVAEESGKLRVTLTLGNANIGHHFPSGASHNRRAWAEVEAFVGGASVFRDASFVLRQRLFDAHGNEVRFMWQAASFDVASIAPQSTKSASWLVDAADRVTARVRITPFAAEVADDLIASGDLDPRFKAAIPTFDLRATEIEWTADRGLPSCIP